MQATLPPVWSEIERFRRRRGRVSLSEIGEITARAHQVHMQELRRLRELHARLDWPRVHRPEILLYTPNQLRQLIRLGNAAEAAAAQATSDPWRPGPLGAPWHLPDTDPSTETQKPRGGDAEGGGEWWWWRGWGAGALLLVTALLLVRATDRCVKIKRRSDYVRPRRRRSEEWPTPNVLATSQHPLSMEAEAPSEFDAYRSESSEASDYVFTAPDLPPPYTEVSAGSAHQRKHEHDPPPPYSACYVAYSNPKHATPSVTFLDDQRQNIFEEPTSSRAPPAIAHSSNGFNVLRSNPIGDVILKIPYADTSGETDSDGCNGECLCNSLEQINVGPAPIATEDMTIEVEPDDDSASYITILEENQCYTV